MGWAVPVRGLGNSAERGEPGRAPDRSCHGLEPPGTAPGQDEEARDATAQ